jgi:membrane-bound lytic murein transglycosylase A
MRSLLLLLAALSLAACSSGPDLSQGRAAPAGPIASGPLSLQPVSFDALPGWRDDGVAEALPALRKSCDKITTQPSHKTLSESFAGTAGDWLGPCGALRQIQADNSAAARAWAEHWLQPYRVTAGGVSEGVFTGYCEAELRGSRHQGGAYQTPLYGRPQGWPADPAKAGQKLATRAEIEAGALAGKAQVLLWVDDPVDAHILHIQGSGRVLLDDGSSVQVGYDGNNGQEWVGLGKILIRHGLLGPGESNMPSVRAWLKSHPAQATALMDENPRYVFFRMLNSGEGPIGAQGVPLTAGRSLAVDTHFIPLGTPLWLDTTDPSGKPLRRLMVAQDTGKAITGPVRGDFFWGPGEAAFNNAGRMNSRGGYYILLPRQRSAPVAMESQSLIIAEAE